MDEDLNLSEVDFDKILNNNNNNQTPSFFRKSIEAETKQVTKIKIPREQVIRYINEKMSLLKKDMEYYDSLFKKYRDLNKSFKDKILTQALTDEEKLIQYQEELHLIKELIIENSFLVPVIKNTKEDIIKFIESSNQILIGTGVSLDDIKKNLDEYIKIYSNHAYQGNQISIILREIHKISNRKNLEDMTNIDFINE